MSTQRLALQFFVKTCFPLTKINWFSNNNAIHSKTIYIITGRDRQIREQRRLIAGLIF
jgi:hypothetical protein